MGYARHKFRTEHNGAKHGKGAWYGPKKDAKFNSNKARRSIDRMLARGDYGELNGDEYPFDETS